MKVSPESLAQLQAAIAPLAGQLPAHAEALPTSARPPKDLPQRVRWDALWASKFDLAPLYAAGCTDTHVDTALREIMRRLNLPQFAT